MAVPAAWRMKATPAAPAAELGYVVSGNCRTTLLSPEVGASDDSQNRRRLSPRALVGFGWRRGLSARAWLGAAASNFPSAARSGSSRGACGNLSSLTARRIAAVTAASSSAVRLIVGTARI